VVLVDTLSHVKYKGKDFDKRKAVKGFVDGLLDLIVETEEVKKRRVDYLGKQEFLYLGPDEQVSGTDGRSSSNSSGSSRGGGKSPER